jgi:hypothetical protein
MNGQPLVLQTDSPWRDVSGVQGSSSSGPMASLGMSKRTRSDGIAFDHIERRAEIRIDIRIGGKFSLANKRDANGDRRKFACRTINISQSAMVLAAPLAGAIGERVIAYFEEFGELNGAIVRVFDGGFAMKIVANPKDRAKFWDKLLWLKESQNLNVSDRRSHIRIIPQEPRSNLVLSDGRILECFIIDMSASGAAVSADIVPSIGTPLAVGKVVGKVIRHFEDGFAVRFNEVQDLDHLERLIVYDWSHEVTGAAPAVIVINDEAHH